MGGPAASESFESASQQQSLLTQLTRLERQLSRLYNDAHCRGHLERLYRPHSAAPYESSPELALLQILTHLTPLTNALMELGYYDVALQTTEVAAQHAPSADVQYTRAYLLALLGETAEAETHYLEAYRRYGRIPSADMLALRDLVLTHADEEDLGELYDRLAGLPAPAAPEPGSAVEPGPKLPPDLS